MSTDDYDVELDWGEEDNVESHQNEIAMVTDDDVDVVSLGGGEDEEELMASPSPKYVPQITKNIIPERNVSPIPIRRAASFSDPVKGPITNLPAGLPRRPTFDASYVSSSNPLSASAMSERPLKSSMPPGWEERTTKDGEVYYFNLQTRQSSSKHPANGLEPSDLSHSSYTTLPSRNDNRLEPPESQYSTDTRRSIPNENGIHRRRHSSERRTNKDSQRQSPPPRIQERTPLADSYSNNSRSTTDRSSRNLSPTLKKESVEQVARELHSTRSRFDHVQQSAPEVTEDPFPRINSRSQGRSSRQRSVSPLSRAVVQPPRSRSPRSVRQSIPLKRRETGALEERPQRPSRETRYPRAVEAENLGSQNHYKRRRVEDDRMEPCLVPPTNKVDVGKVSERHRSIDKFPINQERRATIGMEGQFNPRRSPLDEPRRLQNGDYDVRDNAESNLFSRPRGIATTSPTIETIYQFRQEITHSGMTPSPNGRKQATDNNFALDLSGGYKRESYEPMNHVGNRDRTSSRRVKGSPENQFDNRNVTSAYGARTVPSKETNISPFQERRFGRAIKSPTAPIRASLPNVIDGPTTSQYLSGDPFRAMSISDRYSQQGNVVLLEANIVRSTENGSSYDRRTDGIKNGHYRPGTSNSFDGTVRYQNEINDSIRTSPHRQRFENEVDQAPYRYGTSFSGGPASPNLVRDIRRSPVEVVNRPDPPLKPPSFVLKETYENGASLVVEERTQAFQPSPVGTDENLDGVSLDPLQRSPREQPNDFRATVEAVRARAEALKASQRMQEKPIPYRTLLRPNDPLPSEPDVKRPSRFSDRSTVIIDTNPPLPLIPLQQLSRNGAKVQGRSDSKPENGHRVSRFGPAPNPPLPEDPIRVERRSYDVVPRPNPHQNAVNVERVSVNLEEIANSRRLLPRSEYKGVQRDYTATGYETGTLPVGRLEDRFMPNSFSSQISGYSSSRNRGVDPDPNFRNVGKGKLLDRISGPSLSAIAPTASLKQRVQTYDVELLGRRNFDERSFEDRRSR